MNPVKRFFRRYVFSTVGLLALLLAANILLITGLLLISEVTPPRETFSITAFCGHLTQGPDGWQADAEATAMLDPGAWAMVLDPEGNVVWEYQMPDGLARHYSAGAVAMLSRWYLEDWPMTVWAQDDGSLVAVAQPKGSMVKYYLSMDRSYFHFLSMLLNVVVYANVLLIVALFLHSTRRVEKAMGPILNGINSMVSGKPVHLREDGELAEISAGLNRAAAYIVQKDNTRADWIRGISHDIRTPLSVILGYASELEENPALPPAARAQAAVIRRQSEKLTGLVADLNLTTKLEYALRPLEVRQLDPVELARQAVSEVLNGGLPDAYALSFTEAAPGARLTVAGDPALLSRMLANLLHNCVDHNPGGCSIEVMVGPAQAGGCVFTVADDGVGVSADKLRTLNRGAPVASTQAPDPGGAAEHGLGLRIVQQIVRAHHGRLSFATASPHGLVVRVWIGGSK